MAKADIRIFDTGGRVNVPVRTFPTALGGTAINAGEPVMWNVAANKINAYVVPVTDAKPVRGDYFVGIAANAGTHTASANGYVDIYLDQPGTIYALKAKTATTFDTLADVDANTGYRVVFDLTSSNYRADVADDLTTAAAGLQIVGGDHVSYTVYVAALDGATWHSAAGI